MYQLDECNNDNKTKPVLDQTDAGDSGVQSHRSSILARYCERMLIGVETREVEISIIIG